MLLMGTSQTSFNEHAILCESMHCARYYYTGQSQWNTTNGRISSRGCDRSGAEVREVNTSESDIKLVKYLDILGLDIIIIIVSLLFAPFPSV
jgi:hypothetical protein